MSLAEFLAYEAKLDAQRTARLRKRGVLPPEPEPLPSKADVARERELHEQFIGWCRINDVEFVHSRMDRKPTIEEGWPDFTCIRGKRACCVEFKMPGKPLTDAQAHVRYRLAKCGTPHGVCCSFDEAIEFTRKELLE